MASAQGHRRRGALSANFASDLAQRAASVDLAINNAAKWQELSHWAGNELGLDPGRVTAIGVTDTGTAESRLTSIGVIKSAPLLFFVFTTLPLQGVMERLLSLIPLTRHLHTVVVLREINGAWTAEQIVDVRPHGIGQAVATRFPGVPVLRVDEDGNELPALTVASAPTFMLLDNAAGDYSNIDGVRYRFPGRIPNGRQVVEGATIVSYRTVDSGAPDAGCVIGVGRAGRLRVRGDGEREVYFDRFLSVEPIPLSELGDPRNNTTNSIVQLPGEWVADLLERLGYQDAESLPVPTTALTLAAVDEELATRKLFVPPAKVAEAVAAVRAGKHLMFTGPPGTGKTTFGEAVAAAAERVGLSNGWELSTATADWTSADTVGAYRMGPDQKLRFSPGQILAAIDHGSWLVIDELNRADMDKAIGQIFTVLSGQAVVTPFVEGSDADGPAVAILPEGIEPPAGVSAHTVSRNWRLVATLNERDRDLLFELSEALLRRFAIIDVPPPPPDLWTEILAAKGRTRDPQLDTAVGALTTLDHKQLGPAVILDAAEHIRQQLVLQDELEEAVARDRVFDEALRLYVRPHLADLAPHAAAETEARLAELVSDLATAVETDPPAEANAVTESSDAEAVDGGAVDGETELGHPAVDDS